jgi:hypothetical protein
MSWKKNIIISEYLANVIWILTWYGAKSRLKASLCNFTVTTTAEKGFGP